ncbi:HAMP domain-containing protein [Pseudoduganella sp. FT25W]|uniref:histidine kinase n=1 Tax=Duganella alba TaxID=2666081 RepID=A0A6L5QBB0_9BURK|nr:ATP-binding protein [Duganella alba]MRX06602.1 HAMP domain-containing protein [Duganella alba]MRX18048.1 HAMP domain-containing protein [Duganella alba]
MSSVPPNNRWSLHDLRRASSFRIALLFLGLYSLIAALLFAFLYQQISSYALSRIDDWLPRERNAILRSAPADLVARVAYHARLDPDNQRPFGLYSPDGIRLAGAFPGPHPTQLEQPYTLSMIENDRTRSLRVAAYPLADGQLLVLSQDLNEVHEFNEVLQRALASAALLALLLGLAGAVLIGRRAVHRLDAITTAIQAIVQGDLSQRLPQRAPGAASDDLDRLVNVVNGMLDDIERLMHEIKGACDGIAHDLRTPLARLLAGLERAQRRAVSADDYRDAVDAAITETLSLLTTFNAMLRISEVQDGARRAGFSAIDLAAIADDAVEFYEPSADDKQVQLVYERPPGLRLPLRGDASLLFEAIGNLIDNAIKFTPEGGRITVTLAEWQGAMQFDIRDTGPGIPAAEREAVFLRFHRAESSRHLPGNGLGLSLVDAVARLHGMQVAILDSDQGCHISLRLSTLP